jgi:ribosomal protein L11 methylase PrmA
MQTHSIPLVPYFQTTRYRVAAMVDLAEIQPGDTVADLGAGDGRILIAFAEAGAIAHGYELDTKLLLLAKKNIKKAALTDRAFLHQTDFWSENLSSYSVITIYGMPDVMERLNGKLSRELKPGTRVLSNYYAIPGWKEEVKKDSVFKYRIG